MRTNRIERMTAAIYIQLILIYFKNFTLYKKFQFKIFFCKVAVRKRQFEIKSQITFYWFVKLH